MLLPVLPKSKPNDDAMSARLPDIPKPPEDISGAKMTSDVNCLGVEIAIITPITSPEIRDIVSDFFSLNIFFIDSIMSISFILFAFSIFIVSYILNEC